MRVEKEKEVKTNMEEIGLTRSELTRRVYETLAMLLTDDKYECRVVKVDDK